MTNDTTLETVTFGFIGTGSMGGALARAARRTLSGSQILLTNRTREKAEALAAELNARTPADNLALASSAKYIFLGVKPQMMADLLAELAPALARRTDRFVLVSMAAGLTIERIRELSGGDYPVIRIMPNTPASIGEGLILYACGGDLTKAEERLFLEAMAGAGRLSALPESLSDIGTVVGGCGPAFLDLFIEAMADGGVACGLPRAMAVEFAAQMALGAARLVLESGEHPGALKDAVCSPGGSTIQGVRALEAGGFRSAVMEAVIAAYEKTLDMKG